MRAYGYSASVTGDVITLTAAGAITHTSGVTGLLLVAALWMALLNQLLVPALCLVFLHSAVASTYSYDDVTYSGRFPI